MPVRLNSTGGGSVTLDVPATAGTFTVNLPAANGDVVVTGGGSTVQFGPGSVSAPSITFSGDANTGIYSPAADTIAFTEGGVEGMRIDSAGNVGIGTVSPTQRLQVRQDQNATTSILVQNRNASGTPSAALQFISGAFDLADNRYAMISSDGGSNTTLQFYTGQGAAPAERMRITSAGNVGIGTSSPRARSHVSGGAGAPSLSDDTNNIALTTSATSVELAEGAYPGSPFAYWMQVKQTTNVGAAWPLVLQPIGGDVGIGTSSPAVRLDLGSIVHGSPSTGLTMSVWNARFGLGVSAGQLNYIAGTDTANSHVFHTNGSERARITSGGEFLVGTTSSVTSASIQSVTSNFNVVIRDPGATAGRFWRFDADANNSVIIYNQDGNGVWIGNGGTAWNSSSDETLKNILSPIDEAVASVAKLRAVYFAWKVDEEQKRHPGLIAQDVQRVLPEVVHTDPSGKLSISYTEIIPLLVAAIQEQQAQIETLEARLAAVEAR